MPIYIVTRFIKYKTYSKRDSLYIEAPNKNFAHEYVKYQDERRLHGFYYNPNCIKYEFHVHKIDPIKVTKKIIKNIISAEDKIYKQLIETERICAPLTINTNIKK